MIALQYAVLISAVQLCESAIRMSTYALLLFCIFGLILKLLVDWNFWNLK